MREFTTKELQHMTQRNLETRERLLIYGRRLSVETKRGMRLFAHIVKLTLDMEDECISHLAKLGQR